MIITISGQACSGKTTVGKLLAKKLGYKFYDIGTLRKNAAAHRGMTIEEYNMYGETHPETDKDADAETVRLSENSDDFVIQGRLAYHFIPKSFKVYLTINPDVAAKRIMKDTDPGRNSKSKNASLEEIKQLSSERDKSDIFRYRKIYGIEDFTDKKHYDMVLDTSDLTPEQVVEKILDKSKFLEDRL
ncbi:MAG: cytidylate kinase family protein [Candidatus Woesearchaeota archaeon]